MCLRKSINHVQTFLKTKMRKNQVKNQKRSNSHILDFSMYANSNQQFSVNFAKFALFYSQANQMQFSTAEKNLIDPK